VTLTVSLAHGSINSAAIVCCFLTFAILCATKYEASTAEAFFVGKIQNFQVSSFLYNFSLSFKEILYHNQPKNRVLFSDVVLTYLP
jgi:hypothetical protein